MRAPKTTDARLPDRSSRLFGLFRRYVRRYVGRHFHAVRISRSGPLPDLTRGPVIVVLNHPSWWDPLIAVLLTASMPAGRAHYGPIEAVGLDQYRFLARLGFFGIETGTVAGTRRFLLASLAVLARPESILWLTAEGAFVDARRRPTVLRPGIGHLAHRLSDATIVPMGIEYPFWDDRCPEVLVRFGSPIEVTRGGERSAPEWTGLIETALQATLDGLAEESMCRDPGLFQTAMAGTAGVGVVYDMGRRIRGWLGGTTFRAEHASRSATGTVTRPVPHPGATEVGRDSQR